ncbi:MAG: hypothetical protein VB046_12145 [Paludibacter sp.]|nr:hypothetical protein [Paludibacter sp.]
MKRKITFILMLITGFTVVGQEMPAIIFETSKDTLTLNINVSKTEYQNQVWIDLNGNAYKDEGEQVVLFKQDVSYVKTSSTVRIYGPVWTFRCANNDITYLDASGASASLNQLSCNSNMIEFLDVNGCQKVNRLNIYSNHLGVDAMTYLVSILPDRVGLSQGEMTLYYNADKIGQPDENVFTQDHADVISEKNWKAFIASPKVEFTGPYTSLSGTESLELNDGLQIIPAEDGVFVEVSKPMPVYIYNMMGQLIYHEHSIESRTFIELKSNTIYVINDHKILLP